MPIDDENGGGLDWWTFYHPGCTINSAVLGVGGALISQTCHDERCNGAKFCGDGQQLLLRQGEAGSTDSKTNPDQIVWNRRNTALVPVLAGQQIAARDPSTGKLVLLDEKTGAPAQRLSVGSGTGAASSFTSTIDGDLIWIDGRTYALKTKGTSFRWHLSTTGVPTVTSTSTSGVSSLAGGRITAPTATGIAQIDGGTGAVSHTYPADVPAGSRVYPFGTGFVVAGATTTVYK